MNMTKEELEMALDAWVNKVLKTYGGPADTYKMMCDVDEIIAEAFDRTPILSDK